MRSALTHLFCLLVGGIVAWNIPRPKPVVVRRADGMDTLALRPGDLLLSVNGVTDAKMFDVMATGLKTGNVCVEFERDQRKHQICIKSS